MSKICRLCAKQVKKVETLVHILDPNLSIASKLLQCCQINLAENLNLSQLCCLNCLECLNITWSFIERVLRAQEKFKETSHKYTIDDEIETEKQQVKDKGKEDSNSVRSSKRKRKSPLKFPKDDNNIQLIKKSEEIHILNNEEINPQWITFSISDINNPDKFNIQNVNPIYTETVNENEIVYNQPNTTDNSEVNNQIFTETDNVNVYQTENYSDDEEELELDYNEDVDDPDDPEYEPEHEQDDENESDNNSSLQVFVSNSTTPIHNSNKTDDENIDNDINDNDEDLDNDDTTVTYRKRKLKSEQKFDEIFKDLIRSDRNRDGKINSNGLKKLNIKSWNEYPWSCHQCKLKFNHINKLQPHFKEVHKTDEIQYECADCSQVFITKFQAFVRHVIKRHRNHLKYCCELCGEFYIQQSFLLQHKYTHKTIERPFVCDICSKSFITDNALQTHKKVHLPRVNRRGFTCDICMKKFGTRPNLMTHKRIHSGLREYTCEQCGKSFIQKGNLDNHMLTHVQDRPYCCDICDKTFKTKLRLTHHATVHSGLKPYKCDSCPRTFREKGTLKEHQRIHTGVMPFKCDFCDKRFRFKGVLTTHRRQHTGERPYSCVDCNHHFTNWPNYNKHMKRRHKINTSVTVRKPQSIPPSGMPAQSKLNHIVPVPLIQNNTTTTDTSRNNVDGNNSDNQHLVNQQQQTEENLINTQQDDSFEDLNNVSVTTQDSFDDMLTITNATDSYEDSCEDGVDNDNNIDGNNDVENNCDINNIQTIDNHHQHNLLIDDNPHHHLDSLIKTEEYTIEYSQSQPTTSASTTTMPMPIPTLITQDTEIITVNEPSIHQLHNSQMEMTVLTHQSPMQQIIHQGPFNTSIVNYIPTVTPVIGFYNIQTVDVDLMHNNNNNI